MSQKFYHGVLKFLDLNKIRFPRWLSCKELAYQCRRFPTPGLERSPGEGNGNPLQCSCLENTRDGGAWWAAVYGVAQSQTRLKRFSSSSRASQLALVVKTLTANAGDIRDVGSIPGSGRCPGGGHGNPLQHRFWENPTDREA